MLNQRAIEALRNSDITGPALVDVFEKMAQGLIGMNAPGGMLNLNFIPPDTIPAEGELVPIITLALRPFHNFTRPKPRPPVAPAGPQDCPSGEPGPQGPEGIPDGSRE